MEKCHCDVEIVPYSSDFWYDIQAVHDHARQQELAHANLEAAFLPLSVAAERDGLFENRVYVATVCGAAVGFVAFTENELTWLYVHPIFQRHEIGRKLAEFAISQMDSGEKTVEVLCGNLPAKKLYMDLGFTKETIVHGKMPGNESFAVTVWQLTMEHKE